MDTNERFTPRPRKTSSEPVHLSLAELTEQAAVTVRTVRYYIAEGLLPPPVSAGPQSHYTRGHLDRLRLITQMKEAYLPLREIRRRLAGLDDAAVRHLLAQDGEAPPATTSARAYLDQLLGAPPARPGPASPAPPQPQQASLRESWPGDDDVFPPDDRDLAPDSEQPRPLTIGAATPLMPSSGEPAPGAETAAPDAWRRVRLGDDAELLIREAAYQRRPDRIDWLIRWARRVFR